MNKLPLETRTQILAMLCEGSSMRSISRVVDVSFNTIDKLLQDAGAACIEFHDRAGKIPGDVAASGKEVVGMMVERVDLEQSGPG